MNKFLRRYVSPLLYFTVFTGTLLQLETSYAMAEVSSPNPEQTEDMEMGAPMGVSTAKPGIVMAELNKTLLSDLLKSSKLTVSGWTDGSFTGSSASQTNQPLKFNYQANTFLLQQNWLRIDRAIDEESDRPSFGLRSDWILPGSDYLFTLPRGIFNSQLTANNGMPSTYGVDPVQFYIEANLPGFFQAIDFKVGRFNMIHGVEMNEASMNMLASHNYTYPADPFTHTGLLATAKIDSQWTAQAGVATGSDIFLGAAATPTLLSGVRWKSTDMKSSLAFFTILGSGQFNQTENFDNRRFFDLVLFRRLTEKLAYTGEALFGYEYNVPGIGTATWFGFPQYLTYDLNDRTSATARIELFNDPQGNRTGSAGLYTAVTMGLNYRPAKWLVLRPEVRYDYNNQSGPFEGRRGLFTATADAIVRW
jgi:hypothetical protein